jgi:uroporphyrinogen III methyltransferase/synthase
VPGFVSLVGAGPWDPELLTLAGRERLSRADVVIADYLVNPALFVHCPPAAEIHQREAGPKGGVVLDQDATTALMIARARAGAYVVRLKGGDPCMFGRGGEEAEALAEAGIPFELVPGVSSPIAAPESAGIPVTHRDHTPAVTFVSGWEAYDKAGLQVAWEHLAKSAGTLVLMMSVKNARENAERLVAAGRDPSTPAAAIRWGTRGIQRTVVATLATIADRIDAEGLRAPAVLVVGDVVRLRERLQWFEKRPLFGLRVVVARAARQAASLVGALASAGADAVVLPALEVVPPLDPDALARAVANLRAHDGVIVSSPNGVEALHRALSSVGLDARALAGRVLAVVGTGTAAACERMGLLADVVPAQANAEGLVDALDEADLLGRSWLHLRADEGRDVLGPAITGKGGSYTLAIAYRTVRPSVAPMLVRSLLPASAGGEGFDAVCLTSGKAARHLLATLVEAWGEPEARSALGAAKIVALGPVTAAAVRALGLSVHTVATATTDDAMVAAVTAALKGTS